MPRKSDQSGRNENLIAGRGIAPRHSHRVWIRIVDAVDCLAAAGRPTELFRAFSIGSMMNGPTMACT